MDNATPSKSNKTNSPVPRIKYNNDKTPSHGYSTFINNKTVIVTDVSEEVPDSQNSIAFISKENDPKARTTFINKETDSKATPQGHWDHGWAWMVALGASICNFIVFGCVKSSGIILNEVVARFQYPPAYSIIMFCNIGSIMLITPLSTHLSSRVPCRYLVVMGGILITMGVLLTAVATHLSMTYVGLGLLCGSGGGLVLPASYIVINQWFKDKRSKGFALSTVGVGLGGLLFAPILGYLFEEYGYFGALLLNAGLYLHLLVSAALMASPPIGKKLKPEVHGKPEVHNVKLEVHNYKPEVHNVKPDVEQDGCPAVVIVTKPKEDGAAEYEEGPNISDVKQNEDEIPLLSKQTSTYSKVTLLRNPTFLLYIFNTGTCYIPSVITYLPGYGVELGVPNLVLTLVLSINGLADIMGRIFSGMTFGRIRTGRKRMYHHIAGLCAGFIVISWSFADSLKGLCFISFIHGFVEAIFSAQRTVVPFEFVPAESMADAVGLILFSEYVGAIIGPVMHGLIKSFLGTYAIGFIIGGALVVLSSSLMLVDYFRISRKVIK